MFSPLILNITFVSLYFWSFVTKALTFIIILEKLFLVYESRKDLHLPGKLLARTREIQKGNVLYFRTLPYISFYLMDITPFVTSGGTLKKPKTPSPWTIKSRKLRPRGLFCQQHHDIIASGNKLCHCFRAKRCLLEHSQVVELFADHGYILAVLMRYHILYQRMVCIQDER